MKFHQIPIGARFTFGGQTFTKSALSVGQDDQRMGNVFQYEAEVESNAMNPDPQAGFPSWAGYEARRKAHGYPLGSWEMEHKK
jgi:hypothetical protein